MKPIDIREIPRRKIGKAILTAISDDIQAATGPQQLYAGQEAGNEAAVHAIRQLFQSPDADAVLLVDATNAFNYLNRQTAFRNIQHLSRTLTTTLAMAMYPIGIIPLIRKLSDSGVTQAWFVDDATVGGSLSNVRKWWNKLASIEPNYGYVRNALKIWLVVKEDKLT